MRGTKTYKKILIKTVYVRSFPRDAVRIAQGKEFSTNKVSIVRTVVRTQSFNVLNDC